MKLRMAQEEEEEENRYRQQQLLSLETVDTVQLYPFIDLNQRMRKQLISQNEIAGIITLSSIVEQIHEREMRDKGRLWSDITIDDVLDCLASAQE